MASHDPHNTAPSALPTRKQLLGFVAALLTALALLPLTQPDPDVNQALTTQVIARQSHEALDAALGEWAKSRSPALEGPVPVSFQYVGPPEARAQIKQKLAQLSNAKLVESSSIATLTVDASSATDTKQTVSFSLEAPNAPSKELARGEHRLGSWLSILPPLLAVLIALSFKRLLLALGAAVWAGAAIQVGFAPHTAAWKAISDYIWGSVADSFSLHVIGFTISLVGMVHVILKMGGMAGLLDRLSRFATSTRSTRLTAALMGAAIFFDDYANTVVVGSTMRPMTDARKISREKLAYIVDSTSAPIAGLAIISTWIGYEVGLFDELSRQLDLGQSGYEIFFGILGFRFYCILALAFVLLNAWLGRDFGPMKRAEARAWTQAQPLRPGSKPLTRVGLEDLSPSEETPRRWYNAVIPVMSVILGVMFGMYWSGWSGAGGLSLPSLSGTLGGELSSVALRAALSDMGSWTTWRDAFSNADNAKVLFYAAIAGSLIAILLATTQRLLTIKDASIAWARAVPGMWMAVCILVLAWSIRAVCDDLGTSIYLVGAVQDLITPNMLPVLTFALAAIIAFSTGTSWGTMGILLPAMIPLAFHLTQGQPGGETIVMLCFAAVLDGAIFGDHCSPISDTTVMSSIASNCDHIDHVRTQAPYAIVTMLAAAGFGYVGVAFGLPAWLALALGVASFIGVFFVVGRPLPTLPTTEA